MSISANFTGKTAIMYEFKKAEDRYFLSIDNHCEIVAALSAFCRKEHILAGEVYGIGAVSEAVLRFLNPATKKYVDMRFKEQMEMSNLTGNISEKDGEVYPHLHATFCKSDCSAIGGHLFSAQISGACELVVIPSAIKLERKFSEETGLNMYDFRG